MEALRTLPAIDLIPVKLNEAMQSGVEELSAFMAAIPSALRYDGVALVKPLVNEDYEALCLRFEGTSYGSKSFGAVEFRLSCANLGSHRFGSRPKLEFPSADGVHLFEGWYHESSDDFGPKLELRFEAPDVLDLDVWNRLNPIDQSILLSLVEQLPNALREVQATGLNLSRPWIEWQSLAESLTAWLLPFVSEFVLKQEVSGGASEVIRHVESPSKEPIPDDSIKNREMTRPTIKSSKAFQAYLEVDASD